MIRGGVALAAAAVAIALAGCESTEQESAKIAKRLGHQTADATVTQIKGTDSSVRVDSAQIVSSRAGSAAALELTNTSGESQADIPILITAYDAAGKAVYSNGTVGDSSPSGELSLLGAHATVWWVDGNVLATGGTPVRVTARIGAPTAAAPALSLGATDLSSGSDFVGPFIAGKAVNDSSSTQTDVTVYTVALAGSRVVAAGQSLIPTLAARGSEPFQVNVAGSPKGAAAAATLVPAHVS
jgi:hypothetical protein